MWVEICRLAADAGKCSDSLMRYYYDPASDDCRQFVYGGCHGNANRFLTYADCSSTCRQESQTEQSDVDYEGKVFTSRFHLSSRHFAVEPMSNNNRLRNTVCKAIAVKQTGARPGGRFDTRLSTITHYHKKETFSLVTCIPRVRHMWNGRMIVLIFLVFAWRKLIHFWRRYAQETIFTFSFPVTLTFDLYISNLLSCPALCFH